MHGMKKISLLVLGVMFAFTARSQDVGVKTNLLYNATLSPNVGMEIRLAPRWTFDMSGQWNLWTVDGHKWKHWLVQPEARYWFCDAFAKHFLGMHLLGGQYNFGNIRNNIKFLGSDLSVLTDHYVEGWGIGAGLAYGYALPLSHHWNLEFEIGAGYVYTEFDRYECTECRKPDGGGNHHYIGPTKAAINLVYIF